MTCKFCPKPRHAKEMCQMHHRRWLRWGDPFHKRINRGVMDGPVRHPLGPAQLQIVLTLMESPGRVFPWYAMAGSRSGFENAVRRIRAHYGADVVQTSVKPQGYLMPRPVAEKLRKAVLR